MRILVVGAGAIGGYFGGRMLQAGRDVTFLVRPRRAAELAEAGLVIKSPNGDVTLKNPPALRADQLNEKFDVVLLSCKAFDLDDAIKSFAPAVGPRTAIVPLLNGMLHMDVLDGKFGRERVLGGLCAIAATLNDKREVVQLNPLQSLNFGERDGQLSDRVRAIACATARNPNLALAKAAKPLPPRKEAVAPVKKMLPLPRGSISRADSRPATKPAQQAISHTLRNTRSVVSSIGKLTLAPTLKMQTSSGACLSASLRNAATSSSLRASSAHATIDPSAASISLTSGSSLAPSRRPANTMNPSAANFFATSAPI